MFHKGSISKINQDLGYCFISIPKFGDVFLNENTILHDTTFSKLQVGDVVVVEVEKTSRGVLALTCSLFKEDIGEQSLFEVGL